MAVHIICDRALASGRFPSKRQSHVRHTMKVVKIAKKLNSNLNERLCVKLPEAAKEAIVTNLEGANGGEQVYSLISHCRNRVEQPKRERHQPTTLQR